MVACGEIVLDIVANGLAVVGAVVEVNGIVPSLAGFVWWPNRHSMDHLK